MLPGLALIALIVGSVQTTMVLSEQDRLAAEETRAPVVEVQAVRGIDDPFNPAND